MKETVDKIINALKDKPDEPFAIYAQHTGMSGHEYFSDTWLDEKDNDDIIMWDFDNLREAGELLIAWKERHRNGPADGGYLARSIRALKNYIARHIIIW